MTQLNFYIRTPVAATSDNAVSAYQRDLIFNGIYSKLGKVHRELAIMNNQLGLGHVMSNLESALAQIAEDKHQRELRALKALNRMVIKDNRVLRQQIERQQAKINNLKAKLALARQG